MPIDSDSLRRAISNALINAARDWGDNQENVLDEVIGEHPRLATTLPMFKAAAWLNTGLDTTVSLFGTASLAARVAVPLSVAKLTMDGFQELYKNHVSRVNKVIDGDFRGVQTKLQGRIEAAADYLPASPFGKHAIGAVNAVLARRASELHSYEAAYSHCIRVLKHQRFGVIETERETIKRRTQRSIAPLLDKILTVYRVTYAWGHDTLWRVDPARTTCYQDILGNPVQRHDPIRGEKVSCGPEQYWVSHGNMKDRRGIANVLSDIWRLQVHYVDGWTTDAAWVWPATEKPRINDIVASFEKNGLSDFKATLERADQEQWPTTQRTVRGAA